MTELRLRELVPELNSRGAMGRVVVNYDNGSTAEKKPHVVRKILMCCRRAFLTTDSIRKHWTSGECKVPSILGRKTEAMERIGNLIEEEDVVCDEAVKGLEITPKKKVHQPISIEGTDCWEKATLSLDNLRSPKLIRNFEVEDDVNIYHTVYKPLQNVNVTSTPTSKKNIYTDGNGSCFDTKWTLSVRKVSRLSNRSSTTGSSPSLSPERHAGNLSSGENKAVGMSNALNSPLDIMYHFDMKKNSDDAIEFNCRECVYTTNQTSQITKHVKKMHSKELRNTTCKEEGVPKEDDKLARPEKNKHSDERNNRTWHECDLCDFYKSLYKHNLNLHKQTAHVSDGQFPCKLCTCVYRTQVGLTLHINLHKKLASETINRKDEDTEDVPRVPSSLSNVVVNNQGEEPIVFRKRNAPLRDNAPNGNGKFPCTMCSCVYNNKKSLEGHIAKLHKKCSSPNMESSKPNETKTLVAANGVNSDTGHLKSVQSEKSNKVEKRSPKAQYLCRFCPRTFVMKFNLKAHYRRKHLVQKPNLEKVKSHGSIKGQNAKMDCNICRRSFKGAYHLLIHETACHVEGGSYPCTIDGCGCIFDSKDAFRYHLNKWHINDRVIVSPSKTIGVFSDAIKGVSDVNSGEQPEYETIQDVKTSFNCDLCGFYAKNTIDLNSHLKISHVINGVECSCGCSFATATELTYHKNNCVNSPKPSDAVVILSSLKLQDTLTASDFKCLCGQVFETRKSLRKHESLGICQKSEGDDGTIVLEEITFDSANESQTPDQDSSCNVSTGFSEHIDDKVPCSKCSGTFKSELGLRIHTLQMHKDYSVCEICGYHTRNFRCYRMHKKTSHVVNGIPCSYPECSCSFRTIEGLSSHMSAIHKRKLDRESLELKCTLCSFICYLKSDLDKHAKSIHTESAKTPAKEHNVYKCTLCDYTSTSSLRIEDHGRTNHVANSGFKCQYCNNTFKTESGRRSHEYLIHMKFFEDYTSCKICGYQTKTQKAFSLHNKTCHVKGGVQCPDCPCSMKNVEGLQKHMRMLHKKKLDTSTYLLTCSECDFRTYYSGELKRHEKVVHTVSDVTSKNNTTEVLICHLCDLKVTGGIEDHLMRAHVQGGHSCTDCNCSFSTHLGLTRHQLSRHGKKSDVNKNCTMTRDPSEYTVKCEECSFRAKTDKALNIHCLKMHGFSIPLLKSPVKAKTCDLCKVKITGTVAAHKQRCHVQNGFKCTHCCCSFESIHSRNRHLVRNHRILVPKSPKTCDLCNTKISETLAAHKQRCHVQDGFKCTHCCCSFETIHSRNRHLIRNHQIVIPRTCNLCGINFVGTRQLHINKCHVENGLKCNYCACTFANENGRAMHSRIRHKNATIQAKEKRSQCQLCGLIPLVPMSYHLKNSHIENGFKCSQCKCSFETARTRIGHLARYHNIKVKPARKKCPLCNILLNLPLHKHLKLNHVKHGHPCNYCSCTLRTKPGLIMHITKMHKEESMKTNTSSDGDDTSLKMCNLCGLKLTESLENHISRNHSNKSRFKCNYCSCRFTSMHGMARHMGWRHKLKMKMSVLISETEKRSKKNVCKLCGTKINKSLDDHMKRSHVPDGVPCEYCCCRFDSIKGKLIHKKHKHSEILGRVNKDQGARVNGEPYSTGKSDQTLKLSVVKESLTCPKCGYLTTCVSQLNMHMQKSHVRNSLHPCTRCSCGYATEAELIRHKKILHPDART